MSSNPTPDKIGLLIALANKNAQGCHLHEVALGIKQNTEAAFTATLAAELAARQAVGTKRQADADAREAHKVQDAAAKVVLTNCRLRFVKLFGPDASGDWESAGFLNGSTAVPDNADERYSVLTGVTAHLLAVPADESADMDATHAICAAALAALDTSITNMSQAETGLDNAFTARDDAQQALRNRVRGLINELGDLITDEDTVWEDFGLNIPAHPSPPEPVPGITLAAQGGGRIDVQIEYATRSTRFRVQTFIETVDTDWQNAATVKDLEVILKNFTAGQQVKVRVIAANDAGEAAPSPEASVTVT